MDSNLKNNGMTPDTEKLVRGIRGDVRAARKAAKRDARNAEKREAGAQHRLTKEFRDFCQNNIYTEGFGYSSNLCLSFQPYGGGRLDYVDPSTRETRTVFAFWNTKEGTEKLAGFVAYQDILARINIRR